MDFSDSLRAEIASLESELNADPRYVKLREARRLLALYVGKPSFPPTPDSYYAPAVKRPTTRARRVPSTGISAEVLSAAATAIRGKESPTSTRDIMSILKGQGIDVGGTNPQNVVSSLLSKSDDFISHGRSGWTLNSETTDHEMNKALDDEPSGDTSKGLDMQPEAQGREAGPGGGTY